MNGLPAATALEERDSLFLSNQQLTTTPTLKVGLGEHLSYVQELYRASSCAGLRQSGTEVGS